MIKNNARAIIHDQEGKNNVTFDINFSKDHADYIKITLNKKSSIIKRDDLWNFVFSIVEADKQQKMIPATKQEMEKYTKQHTVILQKDLKKGDTLAVNCEVNVRKEVADALRRNIEEEKSYAQGGVETPYLTGEKNL